MPRYFLKDSQFSDDDMEITKLEGKGDNASDVQTALVLDSTKVISTPKRSRADADPTKAIASRKKMKMEEEEDSKVNYEDIMDEVVESVADGLPQYYEYIGVYVENEKNKNPYKHHLNPNLLDNETRYIMDKEDIKKFAANLLLNKTFISMVKSPVQVFDVPDKCICPVASYDGPLMDSCSPKHKFFKKGDLKEHLALCTCADGFLHQVAFEFMCRLEKL